MAVIGIGLLSGALLVAFGMLVMAGWLYGVYLVTGQVPEVQRLAVREGASYAATP